MIYTNKMVDGFMVELTPEDIAELQDRDKQWEEQLSQPPVPDKFALVVAYIASKPDAPPELKL